MYFINLRSHAVGGWVDTANEVKIQLSPPPSAAGFGQPSEKLESLVVDVRGRHLLVAAHGFNVNFAEGVAHLSYWSTLLNLQPPSIVVGVLWPGDSIWAHGLDYPEEAKVADESGAKLAEILTQIQADVASISFASHSLGARVVLQTASQMIGPFRSGTLMAGAINDDCLNIEFGAAAEKFGKISVLASKRDDVLNLAFPLGNILAGVVDRGHPWWRGALGRYGPVSPRPENFEAPFMIPSNWDYGHHHYLQNTPVYAGNEVRAVNVPADPGPMPLLDNQNQPVDGWQEWFSASFVRTRW